MPTQKIDALEQKKDDIRASLDSLKNSSVQAEKEQLQKKAEQQIKELNAEIANYHTDDQAEKTKLDELKSDVNNLEKELQEIKNDLLSLQQTVLDANNNQTPSQSPQATPTSTPEQTTATEQEEKGFWGKTKEYVSENWSSFTSGEKRKEEPGKNLLRWAAFLGTGILAYKGVKKLWNWAFWDKEEKKSDDEESSEKKEKKSFWKTWWWKFLKWTGIATATWGWIYLFGKWLHLRWDKENPTDTDSDAAKAEAYDKFAEKAENREAVENYEAFWENVDTMYEGIYKKELAAWYQDQLSMDRISKEQFWGSKRYLWIVPFCLDNKFWTTEEIMQQNTSMKNALAWGIKEMTAYIKGLGNEFLKMFADSYLSKLPSWAWAVWSSLSDKIDNWITSNEHAEDELQYFFRQSIRVQTYLFEKKDQLIDKIATEQAARLWMTKKEILEDEEKYEQYILKDWQYTAFMGTKISSACNVLKNKGIFDATVWAEVTSTVEQLDKERKDVVWDEVWWKDILQIVNEKWGNNLDADEKQKLSKSCENIIKDVDDSIKDSVKASAWNSYWDLFSSDDSALREYWEKSWLDEVFQRYKTEIMTAKTQLDSWTLDADKIKALAESVNNMLALKKEAILWRNCIIRDRDEHGNFILRIPWFMADSFKNLWKSMSKFASWEFMDALSYFTSWYLGAGAAIYVGASALAWSSNPIIKIVWKWTKAAVALPVKVPRWVIKKFARSTNIGVRMNNSIKYGTSSWINYRNLFNEASWPEDLIKVLKSWERNLWQTANILRAKLKTTRWTKFREWSNAFWWIELDDIKDEKFLKEKVFDKLLADNFSNDAVSLSKIKNDRALYTKLLENYDSSPELRRAIKSGKFEDVNRVVSKLSEVVDPATEVVDTAARKAFNECLDKAIWKFDEIPQRARRAYQPTIEKLKALKTDADLAEDEMKAFTKFIDEWFHPKFIPEMKKLFEIDHPIRWGSEKLWERLKKCLSEWNFTEFKGILKDSNQFWDVFRNAWLDDAVRRGMADNLDIVIRKFWSLTAQTTKNAVKNVMRVLTKVL